MPLIWLTIFAALSLKDFFLDLRNHRRHFFFYIFPIYLSLSTFWSPNPLRAVLTVGILWCLLISVIGTLTNLRYQPTFCPQLLEKSFLLSAGAISLFCWIQCFLDIFGISREMALLCPGCTSRIFGFPHPSGFAIEPQFMGNLLLAPVLYSFYLLFKIPSGNKKRLYLIATLTLFLTTTLFLIFSRGAIYSFSIALFFLVSVFIFKYRNVRALLAVPFVAISLLFSLLSQGIFAQLGNYHRSFFCGVTTSLSQLSLNVINLDCELGDPVADSTAHEANNYQNGQGEAISDLEAPIFSGYVEVSTNTRLNFNRLAIESAIKSPISLLFGYGLGSAGTVLYEQGETTSNKEIIQNEYLSLLLETGLVGITLLILSFSLFVYNFRTTNKNKKSSLKPQTSILLVSVILAFMLSLMFFSGLPNALHIYLFPVILFVVMTPSPLRASSRTQTGRI